MQDAREELRLGGLVLSAYMSPVDLIIKLMSRQPRTNLDQFPRQHLSYGAGYMRISQQQGALSSTTPWWSNNSSLFHCPTVSVLQFYTLVQIRYSSCSIGSCSISSTAEKPIERFPEVHSSGSYNSKFDLMRLRCLYSGHNSCRFSPFTHAYDIHLGTAEIWRAARGLL